ncbi:MAG: hypothetical protein IT424_03350 [Pirellulales bacterium]|nr:hypothetical protein [Pirellulales bacterium]
MVSMLATAKQGWVGFDIGATCVKAAQVVRRGGAYYFRSAALVARRDKWPTTPLTGSEPRSSSDEVRCAASLCERIKGAASAALLPTSACDVLSVAAPTSKRSGGGELVQALEAELQRPLSDHIVQWRSSGLPTGKLNVVAAPRAWSDRISADLAAGGWDCRVIDALPWALARATTMASPQAATRTVVAVDWGYSRATMLLVHQGAPALVRSLKDCGYYQAVDAVAAALRVEAANAEIILRQTGLGGGSSRAGDSAVASGAVSGRLIADVLGQQLDQLVREVRRTLSFWQGIVRGREPDSIFLFGGGGALAGVDTELSRAVGLPVASWRLSAERAEDEAVLPPPALFGAAAGLSALAWEAS